MRRPPSVLAASLVGLSCAAAPTGSGGGPAATTARRARGGPTEKIAEAKLGSLAVEKWRLGNGLEVLMAPDPGARIVSYVTFYRVGSRNEDEPAGETGLAHLFEHLMFSQTESDPVPGEFDRRMEEIGAQVNAMTYYDYTAYVDAVPPDGFDLAAELESTRMTKLALTPEQVATERDVVAEERLQTTEDHVDGLLEESLWKASFRTHPYRWPIIGWMKDIKAVTREKALRFYRRYYAPDNALIVLVGRFDPQQALRTIEARYGAIPPADDRPDDTAKPERAPVEPVRLSIERPVPADRLMFGFACPALGHADRAAFEVLDELLTGGPSSRLYRALVVDRPLASSVQASPAPTKDPALWSLVVQMTEGHQAAEAERIVSEAIETLARTPVSPAELAKARTRVATTFWSGLSASEGKAEALGHYDVATGDFRTLLRRADEVASVTAEDVKRVAAQYLTGARAIAIATPKPAAAAQK